MSTLKFPTVDEYPEGYNWFAYDRDGYAYYFTNKPTAGFVSFFVENDVSHYIHSKEYSIIGIVPNWKDTLVEKSNPVSSNQIDPDHYKWHPTTECIKVIQEFPANLAMSIKYLWRVASPHARKYDTKELRIQDLRKAIRFIEFEIERINAE